jgi:hypothetical protein
MKKALIVTSALMAIMTTSAFAQTMNDPVRHPTRKTMHVVSGRYAAVPQYPDRFTVIENDRIVGRDPDLSIRSQMRRDPVQNEY